MGEDQPATDSAKGGARAREIFLKSMTTITDGVSDDVARSLRHSYFLLLEVPSFQLRHTLCTS